VNLFINDLLARNSILSFDVNARQRHFKFMGYIARTAATEPDRPTGKALHLWNIASIREYAARNKGNQGHGRCVHVWRLETNLYNFGKDNGTHWELRANDTSTWYSKDLDSFLFSEGAACNILNRGLKRSRCQDVSN
jgi:hypothetical protein